MYAAFGFTSILNRQVTVDNLTEKYLLNKKISGRHLICFSDEDSLEFKAFPAFSHKLPHAIIFTPLS
jgi:hypothetical protein